MAHNSTIINKKKHLKCGHYDYAFSKGRCKQCATIQDTTKRIAEYEMEEDAESWTNLRDDLDAVFSRYIRTKYANEQGIVKCYTSGKPLTIAESQCGHFIPRVHLATRWDERNCRPQSQHDNEFLQGNLAVFAAKLEAEQKGIVDELKQLTKERTKIGVSELKELLIQYRHKLKLAQLKLKK
jgi:hypothetical protein